EHTEQRRGALVSRVTSDIETLAQFLEWGATSWIVNSVMIVATFAVMAAYEWRLALVALVAFLPLTVLVPALQRRQLAAQDRVPPGYLCGACALARVVAAGAPWGPGWGLGVGEVVAFVFLINLLLNPLAELSEVFDQTQIALAGWRKVLGVLATPPDVPEPAE